MLKKHKLIIIVLALGLCLKLFFSGYPPFKIDMDSWIAWGEQMYRTGPGGFYSSGIWTDYAPGYMYFLWFTAAFKHAFFPNATRENTEFLFKMVPLISDLLCGLVIYFILRQITDKKEEKQGIRKFIPEIFAAIYLLSPFTTLNSSIWGQADSVYTLFLLISMYYMIVKKYYYATIFFTIGAIIKPQAVVLIPLYLIIFLSKNLYAELVKCFVIGIITFYVFTMPFWGINAMQNMAALLSNSLQVYPYSSINTFNLWGIWGFWKKDNDVIFLNYFTQQSLGTLLYAITVVAGAVGGFLLLSKNKDEDNYKNYFLLAAYFIFSAVFFLTRMHERYIFGMFAFLLLFCGYFADTIFAYYRDLKWPSLFLNMPVLFYILMAALHTINVYYVYVFYLYFNDGVPAENSIYFAVSNNLSLFSQMMAVYYIGFLFILIYYGKKKAVK